MTNSKLSSEALLDLGFIDIGCWQVSGEIIAYNLDGNETTSNVLLDAPNALYAFVRGDEVLYIGKTARSIRRRYIGYCRPGNGQQTNWRCHHNIKKAIADDQEIRIFVFTPSPQFRYGIFDINLAAGLEDSLIARFKPSWNGGNKKQPISEEAEREKAEEDEAEQVDGGIPENIRPIPMASSPIVASFTVELGPTYYQNGFLNPGVEASGYLGKDGDPIRVRFGDGSQTIVSKINRTANRTGAVRIVGSNQRIAQWFQEHFNEGDTVQGNVIDSHTIELLPAPDPR